jgi:hypothetical protein
VRRDESYWLHVALSGLLLFIIMMYAGLPLARHLGFRDWPQAAQDLYIGFFTLSVVGGSAGAVVGGSFCYTLSRSR